MTFVRARNSLTRIAIALALFCAAIPSRAQQGDATFVTRGGRGTDVLVVTSFLDTSPSMTFGNMSVTISTATGPATADRDLTVVFYIKSLQSETSHIAYHVPARLDEGQSQVTVEIPHSQFMGQSAWDVRLYENGRDIEDRRKKRPGDWDFQWSYQVDANQAIGFIMADGETPVDVETEATLLNFHGKQATQPNPAMPFAIAGNPVSGSVGSYRAIPLKDAKSDWRLYLPYEAWVMSAAAFEAMVRTRPEVATALRDYVGCGGTLLVHNAISPRQEEMLNELFWQSPVQSSQFWTKIKYPSQPWWYKEESGSMAGQRLVLRKTKASESVVTPEFPIRLPGVLYDSFLAFETWNRWSWGNHVDNLRELSDYVEMDEIYPYWVDETRQYLAEELQTEAVLRREYLNGVVLIAKKPLVDMPQDLLDYTRDTELMQGVNVRVAASMDGNWFWRNLISAVGKPPVWVFCGIVTLFGMALGPGLLVLTGRIKRRSLMIFLVPLVSFLATVCIIVYGVLHEGFDTHARVTSVQFVEPQSERGFVWTRQNYFSGLPPREGIAFNHDAYVRPVLAEENRYGNGSDPKNGVQHHVYLGEQQVWQDWLKARQQQQLMIGHPVANSRMPIAIEAAGSDQVSVENLTQEALPLVVLRGAGQDYYYIETLGIGQSVIVAAEEKAVAEANVARIVLPYRPELPPELTGSGSMLSLGSRRGLSRAARNNETEDVVNAVFERYLSDHFDIPPYGFAVVQTQSDAVYVPVDGNVAERVHVVVGVQPW